MDETETTFDPSTRRLCPDGACLGTIGEDDRCRLCGRSAEGGAPAPVRADEDDGSGDDRSAAKDESGAPAFDASTRRLCPDGTCVGVLGPDGVCPICGRREEL